MTCAASRGPLGGIRIVEIGSIGPGPFAATVLAQLGADVVRLHKPGDAGPVEMAGTEADKRGRIALAVDLKQPAGRAIAMQLTDGADALLEGFRPGVMERLGLGPDELIARNPRLVYARLTGYGQHGPMSQAAGHDINYTAMAGVLGAIGRPDERPVPPLNLIADYGGGGMLAALGIVAAILDVQRGGAGQVVDVAMVDGVAQLASLIYSFAGAGAWGPRGTNILDGGAHFYEVYETADGGFMAVGAIEPQFYAELVRILEIAPEEAPQFPAQRWPELKKRFATIFATKTRAQWTALFESANACTTPVLTMAETPEHPHHRARESFEFSSSTALPVSAPRFGRYARSGPTKGPDAAAVLGAWGLTAGEIEKLSAEGAFASPSQ
jgi:alpha-methylacyl-CoA racemase